MRALLMLLAACAGGIAVAGAAGCAPDLRSIENVAYDARGTRTTMDVFVPEDGLDARPAVMFIHGGGWRIGSKAAFADHAERLAGAGYVTATINYRLIPDATYPEPIRDTVCALSFLRAHADEYGLDPDRIAVVGYSAGGHLASLLGVGIDTEDFIPACESGATWAPAAVVAGAGPQDLRDLRGGDGAVEDFLGGSVTEVPERYDRASPLFHVEPGAPPYLFIHGTSDLFVDIRHSERMRDALVAAGTDARLLRLDGVGHLVSPGVEQGRLQLQAATDQPEAWLAMVDFLDRTLGAP